MGNKAETYRDLGNKGDHKFVFLGDELRVGDMDETHLDLLKESGRKRGEITIAGAYVVYNIGKVNVIVNGSGSLSLQIPEKDAKPVAEFIKNFRFCR